ncbi:MAG: chemotaxis protein CheA [Symploca sp. SIO2E9]|nr:chemotaxis protein CheA [Symploca sp. SIO2E9]
MEIDEDLKAFLIESYENLNQIEADLVTLEQDNAEPELMHRIYRALHTIKGNSGFMGLDQLQLVAHAGENLLSRLRDRYLTLNPDITSALLLVVDAVRQLLQNLESTGEEGDADYADLLERLSQLQEITDTEEGRQEEMGTVEQEGESSNLSTASPLVTASSTLPLIDPVSPTIASQAPPVPEPSTSEAIGIAAHSSSVKDSSIRLDVGLLDKLMNLVGELVLSRNQILEFANKQAANKNVDPAFMAASQRLKIVTSELQEGVMKTRLQPIRKIWGKFPRVVRDIAVSLNKEVYLEMEGEDTELDKTLIEAIADPLTHIVRNCVDHGIESPDVRTAKYKSAQGRVFLRAFHESGHVNIEIADDGIGIDAVQLKEKAVQRGLITTEKAARMSDAEALNLIFLPGLSTAKQVTNLSGRGVGMDVVRTNIEKINGTIDVQSRLGLGTTFKLKIPLTLAIIPTLIVTSGGDRYAIPQINLLELVRLEGKQGQRSIEMVHASPVYRLRGNLLPLVYLNRELKLEAAQEQIDRGGEEIDSTNIVVLQATDKPFGLVVDAVNDTQEIVVKPLSKQLNSISCFAGATIMGDGRVALILDVQGLAQRANLVSDLPEEALAIEESILKQQEEERESLLLFQGPNQRRMAIPLSHVARLEEFPRHALEKVGNQLVIQYRNQIMPLVDLEVAFAGNFDLQQPSVSLKTPTTAEEDKIQFIEEQIKEMSYTLFIVPESMLIYRSQQEGMPLSHYAPTSKIAKSYEAIANYLTSSNSHESIQHSHTDLA